MSLQAAFLIINTVNNLNRIYSFYFMIDSAYN